MGDRKHAIPAKIVRRTYGWYPDIMNVGSSGRQRDCLKTDRKWAVEYLTKPNRSLWCRGVKLTIPLKFVEKALEGAIFAV